MSNGDIWAIVYSYLYAFGLLGLIEWAGKKLGWPQWLTRKLVHIGAGMWIWGILALFDNWYAGIIPFATFIVLNYIFYKLRVFKTMDEEDSSPGTIYFAVSITVLFLLFWRTGPRPDHVYIAAAGVMAMTWGDALASLIGKSIGKRRFVLLRNNRTLEGSLAMFVSSLVVIFLCLYLIPGSILSPLSLGFSLTADQAFVAAVPAALLATVAEGLSPAGTDNLTVPLITSFFLWWML